MGSRSDDAYWNDKYDQERDVSNTYTITLRNSGPWAGCENEDTYTLAEMGYSDEEWDALSASEQEKLVTELAEQEFWNAGYEYSGEVNRG
jgi:hypothetical protein